MFLCKYSYKIKRDIIRAFEEQLKMMKQNFQSTHFNGKIPSGFPNGSPYKTFTVSVFLSPPFPHLHLQRN